MGLSLATDTVRWKIGDLARLTGKTTRAVRLYEEMGLLGPITRTEGGHRLYGEPALQRLECIGKLHSLGLSLNEMKDLVEQLTSSASGPARMQHVRRVFQDRLRETAQQIEVLRGLATELESSLAYLESCTSCDPSTLLSSCSQCDRDHSVPEPGLISGLHGRASEKEKA
jgi:MerR family transcriptional regulator, copper efflux regulator